jgi:hypothetical protein
VRDGWDDDQLLTALGEAIRARQAVPAQFIEAGKNAYAWHNIDAELAQLTYDSSQDESWSVTVRSETASIRALTFTSAHFSIDLELTEDSLLGQIVPSRGGTIEARTGVGATTTTAVDQLGRFSLEPVPASPFRLHYRTAEDTNLVTGWITL